MKKRLVVFVHLMPAMLSLLLIGAHFLRAGNVLVLLMSLLLITALCIREPLVARTAQVALLLATAEWIHVAYNLVMARLAAGAPWSKLVAILGAVAALSLLASALFRARALQEMYHLTPAPVSSPPERTTAPKPSADRPSPPQQSADSDQRQRLLAVYHLKSNLTTASLLTFLLMEFSTALGMVTLIAIGIINSALRSKLHKIGGTLSPAQRQGLYVRQSVGLGIFALPIIAYYAYSLPALIQPLIVTAIITTFTLLLWALARYEYLHMGHDS